MAELEDFIRLTDASRFYINESFHYAHSLMESKLSSILFSALIDKIDPTNEDIQVAKSCHLDDDTLSL